MRRRAPSPPPPLPSSPVPFSGPHRTLTVPSLAPARARASPAQPREPECAHGSFHFRQTIAALPPSPLALALATVARRPRVRISLAFVAGVLATSHSLALPLSPLASPLCSPPPATRSRLATTLVSPGAPRPSVRPPTPASQCPLVLRTSSTQLFPFFLRPFSFLPHLSPPERSSVSPPHSSLSFPLSSPAPPRRCSRPLVLSSHIALLQACDAQAPRIPAPPDLRSLWPPPSRFLGTHLSSPARRPPRAFARPRPSPLTPETISSDACRD